ncbi:LysR family transcriptional regulator [Massilia arenosa]|uniref:LysR family transcriptional regulator n=1 Tax=Zemynaea arenosa TaxID=2561931 RepID=A0A4Y9SCQ7_9BURK|nr:LysR family transcriptional regulator [Massilia arenosa]TFW19958.1 LysR family transcriptional regulator [Massilia arenosa]
MDRLDELQVFLAILDSGNMAAAARRLNRSPPAVTRILTALEQRVGARLFERSTRRLVATDAGTRLAEQARRLLADYDSAVQLPGNATPRGLLRVAAPLMFGRRHVTPIVLTFLQRYPEVQVDLRLADRNVDLIEEGIDAAFRIGPLSNTAFVARQLGQVRRVVVASPAYLDRCGEPSAPAALSSHELILATTVRGLPEWRFKVDGREQAVRVTPRLQLNDMEAVLHAALDGFGIARVLSYQAAPALKAGQLVRLLRRFEPEPVPVHLVLPSTRHMAPRLRAFIDFAVSACAELDVLR